MNIPSSGRVLALDWGARRIGIAVSDATQLIATPLTVLTYRRGKRLPLGAFLTIVENEAPIGLVVGIALDDAGNEGDSAVEARLMAAEFADRTELPLEWEDESFSTVTAADRLYQARGEIPENRIDAAAAAVMLQSWLDRRRAR